jgi:AbrB family looped-hinge helix DNA binding protein
MYYQSNMTSKGQVTVPKDIRDALGLAPGQVVEFELDAEGNARILRSDDRTSIEKKKADWLNRLNDVRAEFKLQDRFAGMDGLEYQRWIRGDGPEV